MGSKAYSIDIKHTTHKRRIIMLEKLSIRQLYNKMYTLHWKKGHQREGKRIAKILFAKSTRRIAK